ncbi:hypothetical protein [[Mycoplasma] testudinis]|uniref:hypothetical protein n=1 Tax=[Mycoplasma] testudinis TaxID=33924 RepID=UPI0012EBAE29|nr:hypothetical protein [[Mycoplasma] testudinis]
MKKRMLIGSLSFLGLSGVIATTAISCANPEQSNQKPGSQQPSTQNPNDGIQPIDQQENTVVSWHAKVKDLQVSASANVKVKKANEAYSEQDKIVFPKGQDSNDLKGTSALNFKLFSSLANNNLPPLPANVYLDLAFVPMDETGEISVILGLAKSYDSSKKIKVVIDQNGKEIITKNQDEIREYQQKLPTLKIVGFTK